MSGLFYLNVGDGFCFKKINSAFCAGEAGAMRVRKHRQVRKLFVSLQWGSVRFHVEVVRIKVPKTRS